MNLFSTAPGWLATLLLLTLAAAAAEDGWRLRISNAICAAILLLALVAMVLAGLSLTLWQNALVFTVLLVLGTMAFSAGWMGGGDVKLLAALGLWVDIRSAIWLIASVFICGGVLALLLIIGRTAFKKSTRRDRGKKSVPYGIAIAIGATVSFMATRIEQSRERTPSLPATLVPPR